MDGCVIKIIRGVKDGTPVMDVSVDGKHGLCDISRELTGTTGEDGNGIFDSDARCSIGFGYGCASKTFNFDDNLDLKHDNAKDLQQKLKSRINMVRDWIASVDHIETLEFEI